MKDYADKTYLKSEPKPEHKGWSVLAATLSALALILANFL
jgi:hypothetical protein